LIYFIIFTLLYFIFEPYIILVLRKRKISSTFVILGWICLALVILMFIYTYFCNVDITFRRSLLMQVEIYICVSVFYLECRNFHRANTFLASLFCLSVFTFGFSKVTSRYEIYNARHLPENEDCTICFKNRNEFISSKNEYCIDNTPEYVFIYNSSTNTCTIYPMSEISSITKRHHFK